MELTTKLRLSPSFAIFLISLFYIPTSICQVTSPRIVSPDNTCGIAGGGGGLGYICPASLPCCSQYGFCGETDAYCLQTLGCQSGYSSDPTSCLLPGDATTPSPDETCGVTGAGVYGYKCARKGECCSMYGFCGNSTRYCTPGGDTGCQSRYGTCWPEGATSAPKPALARRGGWWRFRSSEEGWQQNP